MKITNDKTCFFKKETFLLNISIGRTYPCIGTFIGMRGYDGKVLWKIPTRAGALLTNCEDFDINLDGNTDCVIGGRSATMEAIDVRNGIAIVH